MYEVEALGIDALGRVQARDVALQGATVSERGTGEADGGGERATVAEGAAEAWAPPAILVVPLSRLIDHRDFGTDEK